MSSLNMNIDLFGRSKIRPKEGPKGDKGIGFKLTKDRNYDMQNKRITNLSNGVDEFDAVNKQYVDTILLFIQSLKQRIDTIEKKSENTSKDVKNFNQWVLEHNIADDEREDVFNKYQQSIERDLKEFKNACNTKLDGFKKTIDQTIGFRNIVDTYIGNNARST